jgi:hypothetical protein
MPVFEMPLSWDRAIRGVLPDGRGYAVHFACGHVAWFAIDVSEWKSTHCSQCFDEWRRQSGTVARETSV